MPSITLFSDILESSKQEQQLIVVYFAAHIIEGVVTNVTTGLAELRTKDNKRVYVALQDISAIVTP